MSHLSSSEASIRAVFMTDEAGNIITWNPGCASLFGLDAPAVYGRPVTSLFSQSGRDAWSAGWAALTRQTGGARLRVDLDCAGTEQGASLALAPQHDAGGRLCGWSVAVAIDGAHDLPDAAQLARTPLSSILDTLPGTFWVLDRDGRFLLWNRNMERMTELLPEELAAARATDLVEPHQRLLLVESMRRAFDEGAEMKLEIEYVGKSGREHPFLLSGSRVGCGGADYLFGMGMDISERRVREHELRLRERALHAASNGIVITRMDGRRNPIEYVNPAFERITGYSCRRSHRARPALHGRARHGRRRAHQLREAIAAHRPVNVVLRNLRKDGELFWNDLSITPVHDEHGEVTHFIGVINDVTAAKQRTAHLEHEVNHDPLTGLANRNLLWDRLEQALHLAQRQKSMVATVLIDLEQLQDHQRHLRPRGRRRGAESGGAAPAGLGARQRYGGAHVGRRIRAGAGQPALAALHAAHGRAPAPELCDPGVVQGTRDPGRRQRRGRALSARRHYRGRTGARGRRRHVPRQGTTAATRSISSRPT
jgi:PAS domain S-box-containing protein